MRHLRLLAAGIMLVTGLSAAPASAKHVNNTTPLTSGVLSDWGGPIVTTANVHVLYWGTTWPTGGDATVNAFVPAFTGSTYTTVANEYERGDTLALTYSDTTVDTTSSPAHGVRYGGLRTELLAVYGASLDPNGIYIVLGDTYGHWSDGSGCAWHDFVNGSGLHPPKIPVEYIPNDEQIGTPSNELQCMNLPFGCNPNLGCNYDERANLIAHETLEAVTDPQPCTALLTCPGGRGDVAWDEYDGTMGNLGGAGEIADLCVAQFNNYVLTDSTTWLLQEEWSNAANACV